MKKKTFLTLLFLLNLVFSDSAKANYWLIIGTYSQGTGGRPEVSRITNHYLDSITVKDLDKCNNAGQKISNEIYKHVWKFDSRWACVFRGD